MSEKGEAKEPLQTNGDGQEGQGRRRRKGRETKTLKYVKLEHERPSLTREGDAVTEKPKDQQKPHRKRG